MSQVKYTGHVGTGGLQGHSVSECYPWIVVGYGTTPTTYAAGNMVTGEEGQRRMSARAAAIDVDEYCERDRRPVDPAASCVGPAIEPDEEEAYRAVSVEPHAVPPSEVFARRKRVNDAYLKMYSDGGARWV